MSTKCLLKKRPLCRLAQMSIKCLLGIDIAEYANRIPSKNWTQIPKVKYLIFSNLTRKLRGSSSSASKPAERWLFASSEGFGRYAPFPFFPLAASRRSPRGHATYASLRSVPPLLRFLRNLADVPARRLMPPSGLKAPDKPERMSRMDLDGL